MRNQERNFRRNTNKCEGGNKHAKFSKPANINRHRGERTEYTALLPTRNEKPSEIQE
jgi:hypothetical protein